MATMWEPNGKAIDSATLGELRPEEVLFEFEEPLTFVCRDRDGQMLLAHNLCAEDSVSRYLLVVTDQEIIDGLEAGRLDVLAALRQPRCWIVDFGPGWEIKGLWWIGFDKVPKDHLPKPGAMVVPDLDPLFQLRLVGPEVGPGKTSAADVRMAAEAAETGLRGLARIVFDEKKQAGQVPRTVRDYSDLPYQYMRAASFEIAFGRPRDRLPSVDDAVFDEMGRLLNLGLAAVRTNGEESVPIEGLDDNQTAQLFEAIRALTPPMRGGVKRIELGGELTGQVTTSRVLTRDDRLRAVVRIKAWKKVPAKGVLFRVTGVAEGADKGLDFFVLRKLEPSNIKGIGTVNEIKFFFDDHLYDKVSDAWNSEERITVIGERVGNDYKVLDIQEVTSSPAIEEGDSE
jgi:hypothetical protein